MNVELEKDRQESIKGLQEEIDGLQEDLNFYLNASEEELQELMDWGNSVFTVSIEDEEAT